MKIIIRDGNKKDLPYILKLIKELARYENAEHEVIITLKDLENDGFGKFKNYKFLVAEYQKEIIGMPFYWIRYSTWKGKFLFLEDFVVKESYRRQGVGSKLFEATIKKSKEINTNGMFWQVLDWNTPAINFYKKYKADISNKWLNGRLSKEQIEEIIKN